MKLARPWVKVCGITQLEDALEVERLGADAVGFILQPESRRYLAPFMIREIVDQLRPETMKVGVFVNEDTRRIRNIYEEAGLTAIQLHGVESSWTAGALEDLYVIKAYRVGPAFQPRELADYPVKAHLLDTFVPGQYGGTGRNYDWTIARSARQYGNIIVAGGIRPDNVIEALRIARPWGIDVSSGVESAPGIKDHKKLTRLFSIIEKECSE